MSVNRNIHYDENKLLEDEDLDYESQLYKAEIYDKLYLIAVGKERVLISKKNHYYLPVYIIHNNRVFKQIGAFEYEGEQRDTKSRQKTFLDTDDVLDLNRLGDIILYSFADYEFFNSLSVDIKQTHIADIEREYLKQKPEEEGDDAAGDSDDDDMFRIDSDKIDKSKEMEKSNKVLKEGIFEIDKSIRPPAMILEENQQDAKNMKKDFKDSSKTTYIEKFMKNNNYDIVETIKNGDCLLDALRIAYLQIGHKTTIEKLRTLISNEATDEIFEQYRNIYVGSMVERTSLKKETEQMKLENKDLKKRMEKAQTVEQRQKIKEDADVIVDKYKKCQEEIRNNEELLEEFAFMEGVDNLEDFRAIIKTTKYWADTWAITTLEKSLNIKFVIFSENEFNENDLNSVLRCGQENDKTANTSNPDFYVMVSHEKNHYRLISYKSKYTFRFSEIPYDVKMLIIIKCMEKNAGPYYNIPDFRNLKSKMGIDPDMGSTQDDDEEDSQHDNLFDDDVIFTYYNKSAATPKAGKGNNEKIKAEKVPIFKELNLKKYKDWRKMLDDYFESPFELEGKKWSTVEHYYQASKFKKTHPDFYDVFSLDGGDEKINKDVEMAIIAGSKTGKKKSVLLRPVNVKIDPDFYGGRHTEEREKAVFAKFSQNIVLKEIVLLTKDAKLMKMIPKEEPQTDYILMKVREALKNGK
jgi:predicted NAD-dependent protein-ADP-ribosyltransferase YbiA (DUF1768 family)